MMIYEISLYSHVDDSLNDSKLIQIQEIQRLIFSQSNQDQLHIHFNHYFNADYAKILQLVREINNFIGIKPMYFSAEEILFLSIKGECDLETCVRDLRKHGVEQSLGFISPSVYNSKYYAKDDELQLDDLHIILSYLLTYEIDFYYPLQIANMTIEDFNEAVKFITDHKLKKIILQANMHPDFKESSISEPVLEQLKEMENFLYFHKNYKTKLNFKQSHFIDFKQLA